MARHDREELDIELPDPISYLSFCYTIKGVEIDGNDPKAYCKKSVNTQTERTTY